MATFWTTLSHHQARKSLSKNCTLSQHMGNFIRNFILFADTTRNTSKQVIVRASLPVHFISKAGLGYYRNRLKNETKCAKKVLFSEPRPTNYFLMNMARRFNFSFLDNFSIYYERGDLTRGRKTRHILDCVHHCYTPELIWPELVLLLQLIIE